MMINKNNYESYFLLYIDNELSPDECRKVEVFAAMHPHLAKELELLQQTKFIDEETFEYRDKNSLYKEADKSISLQNYEAYFLLYVDGELSGKEQEETERFVLQHPQLQAEFTMLNKARLSPEAIAFPDKEKLYKTTEVKRRIIPFYITRVAVAAVFSGIVVLAWWISAGNNTQSTVAVDKHVNASAVMPSTHQAITTNAADTVTVAKNDKQIPVNHKQESFQTRNEVKEAGSTDRNDMAEELHVRIAQQNIQQVQPPVQDAPLTKTLIADIHSVPAAVKPLEEITDEEMNNAQTVYTANDNALLKPAVYKELNTDEDNSTLYIASLHLNKTKINGLFKKAAHLVGGKAKEQYVE